MFEARLLDGSIVQLISETGPAPEKVVAPLLRPVDVERATGTLRSPESMIDVPAHIVDAVAGAEIAPASGAVVGFFVHTVSRRAAVIGPFSAPSAARAWWYQPFNRLAKNTDVVFVVLSVTEDDAT